MDAFSLFVGASLADGCVSLASVVAAQGTGNCGFDPSTRRACSHGHHHSSAAIAAYDLA